MTRSLRLSGWPAALLAGIGLAGCAAQTESSGVTTSPVTMVCDGGKSFTVAYSNGFETAVVEVDGQRHELQKVRTTMGMNPTPGLNSTPAGNRDPVLPQFQSTSPGVERGGGPSVTTAGTTGVRYSGDDAYYLSRNQAAALEIGDQIYSNCQVTRT
jgi:Membrane-bound lysozyme-inhibitor of c-type lysozyme